MLIFSERTWKHHCVTLALPFAVLTYFLGVCRPGRILRAYLVSSLLAAFTLMLLTSTPGLTAFDEIARKAEVYGAYVWAYFVLVAALVTILRTRLEVHEQAMQKYLPSRPATEEISPFVV